MTALNFPASPTLNQTYSANEKTYLWNGTSWLALKQQPISSSYAISSSYTLTSSNATSASWAPSSSPNIQTFDASDTWNKPSQGAMAFIEVWGAGGGGGQGDSGAVGTGGAGGAYVSRTIPLSSLGQSETVTVGAGGIGANRSGGSGSAGGNSSFGNWVTAYGGSGGVNTTSTLLARYPGSPLRAGNSGSVVLSVQSSSLRDNFNHMDRWDRTFAGGWALSNTDVVAWFYLKDSVYGGGAGGTYRATTGSLNAGGTSSFGGSGGASVVSPGSNPPTSDTGSNGIVPAGGGGAGTVLGVIPSISYPAGNGASGRVKITVW